MFKNDIQRKIKSIPIGKQSQSDTKSSSMAHLYKLIVLTLICLFVSLFIIQGNFLFISPCLVQAQSIGDYGDAPDGTNTFYPILSSAGPVIGSFPTQFLTTNSRVGAPGIHHLVTNQEWFGNGSSPEAGANDPGDPDGFPNLENNDGFDDGLPPIPFFLVLVSLPPQASITFFVTVAPQAPPGTRYINMLIDWDQSGDWQDIPGAAPEWVLVNFSVNVPPGTTQAITAPIPWGLGAVLSPQIFWMRMTLSRNPIDQSQFAGVGGWDGSGVFQYGETEDFLFHPQVPHSVPPQWNPPPIGGPPGWFPANLPSIDLVPKSQVVPHGVPAWVHVVLNPPGSPLPSYGWAVDPGQRGNFLFSPGSGGYMGPGSFGPEPSGSTATMSGSPPPPAAPPGTIDWITINSIVHPLVPPTEEWPVRVRARWSGIRVQTRKAIVHIIHSGFGSFGLMGLYDFYMAEIENLDIPIEIKEYILIVIEMSLNAFQTGNIDQAIQILEALRQQIPTLGLPPAEAAELNNRIDNLIQGLINTGPVPVPQITDPEDGSTIKGIVTITETTISPDVTSNKFEYTDNGNTWTVIGTDYNGADGWSFDWDTTGVEEGSYLVRATMENTAGLQGTDLIYIWVDNSLPTPQFISPTEGEVIGGILDIQVTTEDDEDDIQCSFEISLDGINWFDIGKDLDGEDGWTTQLNTGQLEDGNYVIRATMIDCAENENSAIIQIKIVHEEPITINMELPKGWSMISLPLIPDDKSVSLLFPGSVVAYGYEKGMGYVRVEELEKGRGYWMLLDSNQNYELTGQPINEFTQTVNEDKWDMIGGCSGPAKASINNGKIEVIYKYVLGSGYKRVLETEHLEYGRGYWILMTNILGQATLRIERID